MRGLRQIRASAGSGKTYQLTENYIDRLLACASGGKSSRAACDISTRILSCAAGEILAVTFTNAAATQMRKRIISRLKRTALGVLSQPGDTLTPELAGKWLETLLRDMNSLNIRTIDSLLHIITRASALELGLNPDFEAVLDTGKALMPYLEKLLDDARDDPASRQALTGAIEALVKPDIGFTLHGRLEDKLKTVLEPALLGEFADLSGESAAGARLVELENALVAAASELLDLVQNSSLQLGKKQRDKLDALLDRDFESGAKSDYFKKDSAASLFNKKPAVPASIEKAYQDLRKQAALYNERKGTLATALKLMPFIRVATLMVEDFKRMAAEEGRLPNALVPGYAAMALEAPNGVPDVICRLGTRLMHFLVDEFQDTSRGQWRILKFLVEEALANGGSLTWVGDVKQSIYGWRSGDPQLFDEILSDRALLAIAPCPERQVLKDNWRSSRQIINHNNSFFGSLTKTATALEVMTACLPDCAGAEELNAAARHLSGAFADVEQKFSPKTREGGFVTAELIAGDNAGECNEKVFARLGALIAAIGKRRPYSDILVLTRSNDQARDAARMLVSAEIPVITENSLLLAEHPVIIQTIAFLKFLENPEDDLAFWSLVTGPIFLGHPECAPLDAQALADWAAERTINSGARSLYQAFRGDFPAIWKRLIEPFHNQAFLLTPYDIVMEWLNFMRVETRFASDITFIRRFMEILMRVEDNGFASITSFLEYWREEGHEEKAPMPEYMDAVRIMTIHKAKGLQAPVVIVPWTNFNIAASGKPITLDIDGLRLPAMPGKDNPAIYVEEMRRQTQEAINLLYVAFTRAEEELHYFYNDYKYPRLSKAIDILLEKADLRLPYNLGQPPTDSQEQKPESDCPQEPREVVYPGPDWLPMQWLPALKIFREPKPSGRLTPVEKGIFMHFCLERLFFGQMSAADSAAFAFNYAIANSGISVPDDPQLAGKLLEALSWYASQPGAPVWLHNGWREQSFLDADGAILRADLLVPMPGGALVIDYKTGTPHGDHIIQIRKYIDIIAQSGQIPGKITGLLVYLEQKYYQVVTSADVSEPLTDCPQELYLPIQ